MPPTRPSECPACGHEGIRRSPPPLRDRHAGAVREETWVCRLCAYAWTRPAPPARPPLDGIDVAHPRGS